MTQREAFEAWYVKAYHHASLEQVENGCYLNLGAGMAWDAWTAAQAQAAVDPVNEWTVIAPDGTRFTGPTPLKAAFPASKYRLEIDPVAAEKFAEVIEQIREEGEKEHDECMEKFGTLDCPHCCGSGHIGDVKNAQEPVAWTNASWLSNPHAGHFSAKKTDCFNVPLFTTPPQHQAAMKLALEALRELADCGADAWSAERPCVKDGYAAIAALEGVL